MTDPDRILRDRYRLGRVLGQNGASTTFEAVDEKTGLRSVVKELSVGAVVREGSTENTFDGDDFTKLIDLFAREARVLSNLDHPGIPRFVDHFDEEVDGDTRLYTVQEFVEGDTIESLVRGGRHFTEEEAVRFCRELVAILGHLHDRSPPLVHRDVKPSNVILGPHDTVHLVDFGSVRNVRDSDGVDGKTIVGTYGYMPIEQYEARAVPQSDFYALGMTLVYLLSHRDPTRITRTGMSLDFRAHVHVSERFARLIEWMIAPAPEARPPDHEAILASLDPHLLALPDLLEPRALPERAGSFDVVATKRAVALGFGLLGILLVLARLFPFGGLHFSSGRDVASTPPTVSPPRARVPVEATAVPARDGVLTIDIDRDFEYVEEGWPMDRSVGQTSLPPLGRRAPEGVRGLGAVRGDVYYGTIPLGNTDDIGVDYALVNADGVWSLLLDANNNEDVSDDGPPKGNEGSGPLLATSASVDATVVRDDGSRAVRPYALWIWFPEASGGRPATPRFYARHHYRGTVGIGSETFDATVFEYADHDGLYRESGVCLDLNRDAICQEDLELFHDGQMVAAAGAEVSLHLGYP